MNRWKESLEDYKAMYNTSGDERYLKNIKFLETQISNYDGLDFIRSAAVQSQSEIIIHEMGHELKLLLDQSDLKEFWDFGTPSQLMTRFGDKYKWEETIQYKLMKYSNSQTGLKISEYATTNDDEFWAESFATWILGQEETKHIPKELIYVFERAFDYKW